MLILKERFGLHILLQGSCSLRQLPYCVAQWLCSPYFDSKQNASSGSTKPRLEPDQGMLCNAICSDRAKWRTYLVRYSRRSHTRTQSLRTTSLVRARACPETPHQMIKHRFFGQTDVGGSSIARRQSVKRPARYRSRRVRQRHPFRLCEVVGVNRCSVHVLNTDHAAVTDNERL